jgi:glycosidase
MKQKTLLMLLVLLLPLVARATVTSIDHVEPPNWWTGFKESELQLMVHGNDISTYVPSLNYPGVTIERVVKVKSPNYLFLYLNISEEAQAGNFDIRFSGNDQSLTHSYPLLEKNPDPAHAKGFTSADAIYLITPDRFANGDTANDNLEGMGDEVDRSEPGGRHGGDIQGIVDHLDYISGMGFTAIWLNPLLENRMPVYSYHGYSTTDFYKVDPRYGSNEQYRDLVAQAKSKGVGVIMDMIVNHIGSGHWWMQDLPTDDWLNFQDEPVMTSHEHITEQDPYASEYDKRLYSDGWFVKTMPDLNQRNPLMADYLTQNALWWIEYLGLAGIRMDTYPYPDKHYMTEWTRRLMLEYPDFNMVGEEWTSNQSAVAYWQSGNDNRDGYVSYLPSLMDFPLQEAMRMALLTEDGTKLDDGSQAGLMRLYLALANDFIYPDPAALVIFPDNHDMSRIFTQLDEDYGLFQMAMSYVLTMRGVPQIYYGTEILMANPGTTSHGIIRSDFPGGWEGDNKNAVTGNGLSKEQLAAQEYLRTLLKWRLGKDVIHSGKTTHFRPENGTYVYFRHNDDECVMVALNKNDDAVSLDLSRFRERLQGYNAALDIFTGETEALGETLVLPARSTQVMELLVQ